MQTAAAINATAPSFEPSSVCRNASGDAAMRARGDEGCTKSSELELLAQQLSIGRRLLREGDFIYRSGQPFTHLYVLNSGMAKVVNVCADGREQVVGLQFKGDWLGIEGIARGQHGCDAVAMDTGEVWTVRYDALVEACTRCPQLLTMLHAAMSRELSRERDSMLSLSTLCADARVADFLHRWAQALAERGLRTDQIRLRMSRAEIGNFLGMTLESVSRAMSRLARMELIRFGSEGGRRDIEIPQVAALERFVEGTLAPAPARALQ
jgi:CRP/FNR family transcriptional regulator